MKNQKNIGAILVLCLLLLIGMAIYQGVFNAKEDPNPELQIKSLDSIVEDDIDGVIPTPDSTGNDSIYGGDLYPIYLPDIK